MTEGLSADGSKKVMVAIEEYEGYESKLDSDFWKGKKACYLRNPKATVHDVYLQILFYDHCDNQYFKIIVADGELDSIEVENLPYEKRISLLHEKIEKRENVLERDSLLWLVFSLRQFVEAEIDELVTERNLNEDDRHFLSLELLRYERDLPEILVNKKRISFQSTSN